MDGSSTFLPCGNCRSSCEAAYSATKSGIHGLTKALAKELAPSNIQVNAIACGVIDTEMNARLNEEERAALAEEILPADFHPRKKSLNWFCSFAVPRPI